MNRRQEDDPERDRNSRIIPNEEIGPDDLGRDRSEESDLGRAQSEGNLGNERTRGGSRDREALKPDRSKHDRSL